MLHSESTAVPLRAWFACAAKRRRQNGAVHSSGLPEPAMTAAALPRHLGGVVGWLANGAVAAD